MYRPFTVRINCSGDLITFSNSQPTASNFKSFSQSLEHFFLTVGLEQFWTQNTINASLHRFNNLSFMICRINQSIWSRKPRSCRRNCHFSLWVWYQLLWYLRSLQGRWGWETTRKNSENQRMAKKKLCHQHKSLSAQVCCYL